MKNLPTCYFLSIFVFFVTSLQFFVRMRNTCLLPLSIHFILFVFCVSLDKTNKSLVLKRCKRILSSKIKIVRLYASVNVFRLHDHLRYFKVERSSLVTQPLDLFID